MMMMTFVFFDEFERIFDFGWGKHCFLSNEDAKTISSHHSEPFKFSVFCSCFSDIFVRNKTVEEKKREKEKVEICLVIKLEQTEKRSTIKKYMSFKR